MTKPVYYIRQVNEVKLAYILFSLLCVCVCLRTQSSLQQCVSLQQCISHLADICTLWAPSSFISFHLSRGQFSGDGVNRLLVSCCYSNARLLMLWRAAARRARSWDFPHWRSTGSQRDRRLRPTTKPPVSVIWRLSFILRAVRLPSVVWHCWLGVKKSIRPVKIEWWGTGMVICLECGANDLHMIQLMALPPHHLLLQ